MTLQVAETPPGQEGYERDVHLICNMYCFVTLLDLFWE